MNKYIGFNIKEDYLFESIEDDRYDNTKLVLSYSNICIKIITTSKLRNIINEDI